MRRRSIVQPVILVFVVFASMDAQAENGAPNLPCMPNDGTVRTWRALAPKLMTDHGIMFNCLTNCRANWKDAQTEWERDTQSVIDAMRASGASDILLADGPEFAQSVNCLFPLLHDSLPNRLAMATHPYVNSLKGVALDNLNRYVKGRFGADRGQISPNSHRMECYIHERLCRRPNAEIASALVKYVEAVHIGLIGWAIDSEYGKLVKDHTSYDPADYTNFNGCTITSSISGGGKLIAKYPND